jgi:MFS family permease
MSKISKNTIFLLLTSVYSYFIVVGIAAATFSVILKFNNVTESLIGLSDTIKIVSGMAILLILPRIASKLGIISTAIISLLLYGITILILPFYQNYFSWAILIGLFGAGFVVFRTMEETLTNVIASNENRGKLMGYTSTAMLAGVSTGPILVKILTPQNYMVFVIAAVLSLISGICFLALKKEENGVKPSKKLNIIKYVKENTIVFFSKFVLEFYVQAVFVLSVVYAIEKGYKAENAVLFITFFSLSGFLNFIMGNVINHVHNKYAYMKFGVFAMIILMASLPFIIFSPILTYTMFFFFGICGSGIVFLTTMSIINSRYGKEDLAAVNSALAIIDSVAMILGGTLTGISMDIFGVNGFTYPMLALGVLYIIYAIYLNIKRNMIQKDKLYKFPF